MYIHRLAESKPSELLKGKKVIMLLGARQVGKTTLVEPFAKHTKSLFLNCDVVTDRNRLMTASAQSVETAMNTLGEELLIIDEGAEFARGREDSQRLVATQMLQ